MKRALIVVTWIVNLSLCSGRTWADYTAGAYQYTVNSTWLEPADDPDARGVSNTANSTTAYSNNEDAVASRSVNTRRQFTWNGPGWPTQLTIHCTATATASAAGSNGIVASQAEKGFETESANTLEEFGSYNKSWTFTNTVVNAGFTQDMDHYSSSTGNYGSGTTAVQITM